MQQLLVWHHVVALSPSLQLLEPVTLTDARVLAPNRANMTTFQSLAAHLATSHIAVGHSVNDNAVSYSVGGLGAGNATGTYTWQGSEHL